MGDQSSAQGGYDFSSPSFERLVHLDLKGAAPRLSYVEKLFPCLRQLGATGLLIEYEDMFPFEGELSQVVHSEVYSKEDVKRILELAQESCLQVIPLVQTFGHLEFVLKHEKFCDLREVNRYPNSLCPSHPGSLPVVKELVRQVLEMHPGIKYIHLGADEVWHLGECDRCKEKMKEMGWSRDQLFLSHVRATVDALRDLAPDVVPIVWEDMMRNIDVAAIQASSIGSYVEPMVWHYLPYDEFRLNGALWKKYEPIFPRIWVASAFKGATDMAQLLTPSRFHLMNQQAWIKVIQEEIPNTTKVKGIAFTGWQRFDHFTVLCELLPVALPTLALCLQTFMQGEFTDDVHQKASLALGFTDPIDIDPYPRPKQVPPLPSFPGGSIYIECLCLANLLVEFQVLIHHPSVKGAFSKYQITHNRTNPLHIDQFLPRARVLVVNLEGLYQRLHQDLAEIYFGSTLDEWLSVNVMPSLEKLRKLIRNAEQQSVLNACVETASACNER